SLFLAELFFSFFSTSKNSPSLKILKLVSIDMFLLFLDVFVLLYILGSFTCSASLLLAWLFIGSVWSIIELVGFLKTFFLSERSCRITSEPAYGLYDGK